MSSLKDFYGIALYQNCFRWIELAEETQIPELHKGPEIREQGKWSTLQQLAAATLRSAYDMLEKANFKPIFTGCEQKSCRFPCVFSIQINVFYLKPIVFVAHMALLPHINGEFLRQSPLRPPKNGVFTLKRYLPDSTPFSAEKADFIAYSSPAFNFRRQGHGNTVSVQGVSPILPDNCCCR